MVLLVSLPPSFMFGFLNQDVHFIFNRRIFIFIFIKKMTAANFSIYCVHNYLSASFQRYLYIQAHIFPLDKNITLHVE